MIATVTLNPSLDYIVQVDDFKAGEINRSFNEKYLPGGKGLNVSQVLQNLGEENVAYGFVGGFTGEYLVKLLRDKNINEKLIVDDSLLTRINMKIRSDVETAINGQGPKVSQKAKEEILKQISELKSGDYLVLAGKIPPSLPEDFYVHIMKSLEGSGVEIVVDAEKEQLLSTISHKPFLIKPNDEELGAVFNVNIKTEEDAIKYGKKLQEMGARNILISLGAKGAILITKDKRVFQADSPKGELVNSVGAGDSMVAGFLYGYLREYSMQEALKYGIACGSASAFSENLATKDEVISLMEQININSWEE